MSPRALVFALCFLVAWPKFAIGQTAAGTDLTSRFMQFGSPQQLDATAIDQAFERVRPQLSGMTIIIVPSWLSGPLLQLRHVGGTEYFLAIERTLRETGATVIVADVNTAAGIAANGARVRALIEESGRPVCLLSHSKGGLDTLEALVEVDDATLAKVRCWIALQAPFFGSPLAETAAETPVIGASSALLLTLWAGDSRSLDDLRTDRRSAYMDERRERIARVLARVQTLCVASYVDGADTRYPLPLPLDRARRWMEQRGHRNDALVPTASSVLPGSRFIVLDNIDHTDTIAPRIPGPSPLDPAVLIRALFVVALEPQS